jgi:DNA-directed RNA polymerase subunit RPC12/RpoP/vacuolar-type H+-ATPase subunit I/STV1
MKFNCPVCKQNLEAEDDMINQEATCPNCGEKIIIKPNKRKCKNIKSIINYCICFTFLFLFVLYIMPPKYSYVTKKIYLTSDKIEKLKLKKYAEASESITQISKLEKEIEEFEKTNKNIIEQTKSTSELIQNLESKLIFTYTLSEQKEINTAISKLKTDKYKKGLIIIETLNAAKQKQKKFRDDLVHRQQIFDCALAAANKEVETEKINKILNEYKNYELVSTITEIETDFPNFGKSDVHVGIKSAIKQSAIILILRKRVYF